MAEPLLQFKGVRSGYGEAVVLDDISFALAAQGSLALLGRNGVGKTTLLLTAMGFVPLARGEIFFSGADISHLAPHRRARAGLGWVPQERDIFPSLSVEENLTVAARPGRWDVAAIYALFPRLKERRTNMGNQLSGGEQQMLTIARTLMTNPSLLLLDEPFEGLAPIIIEELTAAVRKMAEDEGIAIILVEQHAEVALALTENALIIERGRIAHSATSAQLLKDRNTLDRYLGLKLGDA
ncbi:ABC transporter ATP-binding protein [Pelagibacterium limicola]|uniref:ABC transporter ATP-binding protein n=1 Tax=Pelagibacterium limicola TaxID=2791022 RepID=UPI0018AFDB26|nr:ABC transporter ATP-binding protein [Pelagibacterium limicola]